MFLYGSGAAIAEQIEQGRIQQHRTGNVCDGLEHEEEPDVRMGEIKRHGKKQERHGDESDRVSSSPHQQKAGQHEEQNRPCPEIDDPAEREAHELQRMRGDGAMGEAGLLPHVFDFTLLGIGAHLGVAEERVKRPIEASVCSGMIAIPEFHAEVGTKRNKRMHDHHVSRGPWKQYEAANHGGKGQAAPAFLPEGPQAEHTRDARQQGWIDEACQAGVSAGCRPPRSVKR